MSRVTLGNLGSSPSAEKQVCIVLAIEPEWVQTLKTEPSISLWRLACKYFQCISFLEEDPVAHFVMFPVHLGRSHSAEKHVRIVLAMEARKSLNTQNKSECLTAAEGHLSSTWCCWRGRWQIIQQPVGLPAALPAALLRQKKRGDWPPPRGHDSTCHSPGVAGRVHDGQR